MCYLGIARKEASMRHNELKTRVRNAVLELDNFTVAELCDRAEVKPDQVYEELAKLKREGFLTSETVSLRADEQRKRHRPLNLYRLVPDPEKRQQLAREIAPFVSAAAPALERSAAAQRAHLALDEIDLELERTTDAPSHDAAVKTRLESLQEKLASVRNDLETAYYESGITAEPESSHPVVVDSRRWQLYSTRLQDRLRKLNNVESMATAQRGFTVMLRDLFWTKDLQWALVEQTLRDGLKPQQSGDLKRIVHSVFAEAEAAGCAARLDTRQDCTIEELACASVLAASAIRWGSDPDILLKWTRRIPGKDNDRHEYNLVNAIVLAGQLNDAYAAWKKWAGRHLAGRVLRVSGFEYPKYPNVAMFGAGHRALALGSLSSAEESFGPNASVSVITTETLPAWEPRDYKTTATFFDPVGRAPAIRLAEGMREKQPDLYVYGPLGVRMQLPGLPLVRLATVLASVGVEMSDAWKAAGCLEPGRGLVVVHSAGKLEHPTAGRLTEVFGEHAIEPKFYDALGTVA
jgi:predicted ArsR family transcriptional regulator